MQWWMKQRQAGSRLWCLFGHEWFMSGTPTRLFCGRCYRFKEGA
jgi:hypothetical protein